MQWFILLWQWTNLSIYIWSCKKGRVQRARFICCLNVECWGSLLWGSPPLTAAAQGLRGCDRLWLLWVGKGPVEAPAACWKQELLRNDLCFHVSKLPVMWMNCEQHTTAKSWVFEVIKENRLLVGRGFVFIYLFVLSFYFVLGYRNPHNKFKMCGLHWEPHPCKYFCCHEHY